MAIDNLFIVTFLGSLTKEPYKVPSFIKVAISKKKNYNCKDLNVNNDEFPAEYTERRSDSVLLDEILDRQTINIKS